METFQRGNRDRILSRISWAGRLVSFVGMSNVTTSSISGLPRPVRIGVKATSANHARFVCKVFFVAIGQ